jgi:CHAT domain-containing protein
VKAFEAGVDRLRKLREGVDDPKLRITVFNLGAELFDDYIDFLVDAGRTENALRLTETSRAQTLAEGLATARNFDPKAIAKARKATVLSYWLGRRRSYLWTITGSAIKLTRLPDDKTISAEVARYRDDVRTARATLTATGARGARLYDLLVKPAAIAPNSRVILVPDRILHTLNFDTLVVPGGGRRYWIEDVTLANASSLQLLARGQAPAHKSADAMLVVGAPVVADRAFPELVQAPKEIASIRKHFSGAKLLTGAQATPAAYFAAKPERFQFVHFVAHGTASRIRPLDSAIILSPDGKRGPRLSAREIAEGRLGARLVTISSCEGAGSATYAGEGLVGLAWAFRRAGAEQVIAALWEVTDTAAPQLMDRMYAEIRAGADPAAALRKAKLALLHSKSPLQQPRHWAPFVIDQ